MLTAHRFRNRVFTWRLCWLGAVALGAAAALALCQCDLSTAGDKSLDQESVTLPPDLTWVPPDAAVFATVRPATLWKGHEGRILRERYPDLAEEIDRSLEREIGLKAAELESLTVVIVNWSFLRGDRDRRDFGIKKGDVPRLPEPEPPKERAKDEQLVAAPATAAAEQPEREGQPALLWIATTSETATLERVHKDIKANSEAHTHKDKTYYKNNQKGDQVAVHFVNERTFVRGSVKYVLKGMERTDTETKGPLAPALRMAKANHHLAVGLQLTDKVAEDLLAETNQGSDGMRRALRPLFRARAAAGFADVGKETRAEVQLFFRDGTQAKAGLGGAEDGLALLRIHVLNEGIARLEYELDEAMNGRREEESMFGIQILEQLESGLRRFRSDTTGGMLHLKALASTDLTNMLARNKDMLKSRAGDETLVAARNLRKIQNSLKQIGLALHTFHDANKNFPPAAICDKQGKALLSWRVAILPYIEQQPLYRQFKLDEPWDSEHNLKLLPQMPKIYAPVGVTTREQNVTFYQGFVADPKLGAEHQTAWETTPAANNPLGATGSRMASFQDGLSNTLLVVEAGEAVPWTKPADLTYEPKRRLPRLGGMSRDGFHVLLADGSVRYVQRDIDEKTLRLLITRADGQPLPAFEKLP